jgi:hypothetical protein
MVEILVDGIGDLVAVEGEKTVADIVAGMRQWSAQQHRVITGIRLDGGALLAPDEAGLSSRGLEEIGRIEITTESLFVAIANMLAAAYGEIPAVLALLAERAAALRRNPDSTAVSAATAAIERCATCHGLLVKAIAAIPAGMAEAASHAASIAVQAEKIRDTLKQCTEAIERKDYVLLADCCAFDLPDLLSAARSDAEHVYTRLRKASRNAPRPNQG